MILSVVLFVLSFFDVFADTPIDIPKQRAYPLSSKIDPCDDFHGYVCREVENNFKIPDDRSFYMFAFSDSTERLLQSKKDFLAKILGDQIKLSERAMQLKNTYSACINEEASILEEKEFVKKVLQSIDGIKTKPEFLKFLSQNILGTEFSFISLGDLPNLDRPKWLDVYLSGNLQGLPERSYYENKETLKAYEDLVAARLNEVGLTNAASRAQNILRVEKEYSLVHPLPLDFRNEMNDRKFATKNELLKKYPNLSLDIVFNQLPKKILYRSIGSKSIDAIESILEKESLETLKDVYLSFTLASLLEDAYPAYFKKKFEFEKKFLGGPEKLPDRVERCTRVIEHRFSKELDAELLPQIFGNFPRKNVIQVAEDVRKAILEGLKANEWLSKTAKERAMLKIRSAKLQLVAPETDQEWGFIPLSTYDSRKPYSNEKKYQEVRLKKFLLDLSQPQNPYEWHMSPLTVNAYYSASENKFVLPIGILQYPFFDQEHFELNYGALGAVVGHELGHAIDDKGSMYDEKGKLNQWMMPKDLQQFKTRSSKLVKQFQAVGHNGELTLGENIGDLVGVSFALKAADVAYKKMKMNFSSEEKRKFFIQYGRVWCNVMRPKYQEMMLKTNVHALGKYRINEQVKQQKEFADAFSCKEKSLMTLPESDRVRIW